MLTYKNNKTRGDTLIEVLFATAVFSLLAVGSLAIMNQGAAASQRALEITLVRNEIDAQAGTLRFLNASYIAAYKAGPSSYDLGTPANEWATMLGNIDMNNIQVSDLSNVTVCPSSYPIGSFVFDTSSAKYISAIDKLKRSVTYSQVDYDNFGNFLSADGIWIEAIRSKTVASNSQSNTGYVDFYIRACWDSPGQSIPTTIGTIVRLYEPRG